jgi:ClpX C4-type zinc finger
VEAGSEPRGVAYAYALTEEEAAKVATPRPDLGGLVCSFCGRSREEVPHLFSGRGVRDPSTGAIIEVYICDECVLSCADSLARETPRPQP